MTHKFVKHSIFLAIKKNSFESVLMTWMKLEPIIQSEVSQKDKDHYSILTHIYGILKDGNNNPMCRTEKRHRCAEQTFGLCGEGEGGMFQENSIKTSMLSRVKQITSPGWMHETSVQGWCTGKTQRVGVGREEGGDIWMGNTCKSMAESCQCIAKPTTIL